LSESEIGSSPYVLKPQPHSSHSILQRLLPREGAGRRLLDLGCADGYLSRIFAARGFSVTAIDAPSARPRSFPSEIHFLEADLDQGLPALEGTYDYVICADLLEHLRDPGRLLRDVRARLAPGGRLLASLPNSGNIYFRLNVLAGRFPLDDRGLFDRTHVHFYMWKGWNELLNRNGFRIAAVEATVIPFSLAAPDHPGLGSALESLYSVAARAWKKLFAYQFVVSCSISA